MLRNPKRRQNDTATAEISGNSSSRISPEAKKPTTRPTSYPTDEEQENPADLEEMTEPCQGCTERDELIKNLKASIQDKNKIIETLNRKVEDQDNIIANLEAKISATSSSTSTKNFSGLPDIPRLVKNTVAELLERQNCAKALVVSGLPEGPQIDRNRDTEQADDLGSQDGLGEHMDQDGPGEDMEAAKKLVSQCGGDPSAVIEVYRMGQIVTEEEARRLRVKPKPFRLLKIELSSSHTQSVVVKNARRLRDSLDFKDVYVNPSRPKEDRIRLAKLHQELSQRRGEGERLFIDYQALMIRKDTRPPRRIPQNVTVPNA